MYRILKHDRRNILAYFLGKPMKSISTNFRFKPDFHRRIKEAAASSGMSLTAWVVVACLDRLRREGRRGNTQK
jgi:hypothetical protein